MVTKTRFDTLEEGREVWRFTLRNPSGAAVTLLNLGAAIQSVVVPDRTGALANVALGYETAGQYLHTKTYAGAVCGRVANRVGGAVFTLNRKTYRLRANKGEDQLHGGAGGFHQKLWNAEVLDDFVRFTLTSPDGEEGYPGTLTACVTYGWSADNRLSIDYETVCDQDTVCNLTNHAYWNLGGYRGADALAQTIEIGADFFTPADEAHLPTGEILSVKGVFDLRRPAVIRLGASAPDAQIRAAGGYDHNFVLRRRAPDACSWAATLTDPVSGRRMRVFTDQPGVQFYSGFETENGHTGVALETQHFPDAMRRWWFPSIVLPAGVVRKSRTEYRFDILP